MKTLQKATEEEAKRVDESRKERSGATPLQRTGKYWQRCRGEWSMYVYMYEVLVEVVCRRM